MTFALQLRAAIIGNLDKEIADGEKRVIWAIRQALDERASALQSAWRQDVASSGLAKAAVLTKTIRKKLYPNTGLDPAAVVYSTFPLLQRAFEHAKVISAKGGKYLIIPNPAVWPGGRVRRASTAAGFGDGSVTLQAARARFGNLRFIPPKAGRAGLIVAEALHSERTGRFRKIKESQRQGTHGITTLIIFFVVRKARQERRLRGGVIRARASQNFSAEMQRDFDRYLVQADSGPLLLTARSDT